jgi:hypothetical protein
MKDSISKWVNVFSAQILTRIARNVQRRIYVLRVPMNSMSVSKVFVPIAPLLIITALNVRKKIRVLLAKITILWFLKKNVWHAQMFYRIVKLAHPRLNAKLAKLIHFWLATGAKPVLS